MAQETEAWEFTKTRLLEFDSIIRERGNRTATANQYGKVRFICPPDEMDGHQGKTRSCGLEREKKIAYIYGVIRSFYGQYLIVNVIVITADR